MSNGTITDEKSKDIFHYFKETAEAVSLVAENGLNILSKQYEKIQHVSEDTVLSCYESRIRLHIVPEIGNIPLNKLTQNDLQQFYARLKKNGRKTLTERFGEGLSDRMVRMCHATCRTALEKAVQEGLIRTNPAIGCKLPPKRAREMQVLDRDELQRFLIQAQAEGY